MAIGGLEQVVPLSFRGATFTDWSNQIWEYFLAYSTIISRQGSAACYQITCVKNINSTHRIEGVPSQFGLLGALAASKVDVTLQRAKNTTEELGEKVRHALGSGD